MRVREHLVIRRRRTRERQAHRIHTQYKDERRSPAAGTPYKTSLFQMGFSTISVQFNTTLTLFTLHEKELGKKKKKLNVKASLLS